MSDSTKNPWQGKAIRFYEFSCWECPGQDLLPSAAFAKRIGWKKIKGKWHCPFCTIKPGGAAGDRT